MLDSKIDFKYTVGVRVEDKDYIMTLLELIQSKNAESAAWVAEDPENRWVGMLTEDLDHWAEYGVYTAEDYERYELTTYIYEAHKDAFGVKGRHYDFDTMTLEELKAEADYISEAVDRQLEAERLQEQEDLREFESMINLNIALGAGDRETALRWMLQEEEFYNYQDIEHWVWNQGILFTDVGRELVKEICSMTELKQAA